MSKYTKTQMESDKYQKQAKKSHNNPSAPQLQKTLTARKKMLDKIK